MGKNSRLGITSVRRVYYGEATKAKLCESEFHRFKDVLTKFHGLLQEMIVYKNKRRVEMT